MRRLLDTVLGGEPYRIVDLVGFAGQALRRLPWTLRILLENTLRRGDDLTAARSILHWLDRGSSEAEIPFYPARLLMHDTTCVPALVDLAALRATLAESGRDPTQLNPVLPIDVSVDHSLAVDYFGTPDALERNMQREIERNVERYRLLKWATQALRGVTVHPPGSGIMHTINLERLATVVTQQQLDGHEFAFPDTLIGTDSHTPMINGIGVLAWGVGGVEAESVMLGMPVMLRVPDVVGVRLTGSLREGVFATDLALTITERLRRMPLAGKFVEFFGPGVSSLSGGERAVVANMAPEYGASSGYFPIDERTLQYLRGTARKPVHVQLVEDYARRQQLWFEPEAEPKYTEVVTIDLSAVEMSLAGPTRPQDRLRPGDIAASLRRHGDPGRQTRGVAAHHSSGAFADAADHRLDAVSLAHSVRSTNVALQLHSHDSIVSLPAREPPALTNRSPRYAVAIAAITSCTNTSDPRLILAAALLAKKARSLGLRPPPWVKTSFSPGSPTAKRYLRRAGLLEDLEALGFSVVGYGCATCIGNSGPLTDAMTAALADPMIRAVAVLSGNRNFPGRVHDRIDANFLASPALVVACALAGEMNRNILQDPLGTGSDGVAVYLRDVWPTGAEIDAALHAAIDPEDVTIAYQRARDNETWGRLDAPKTALFPWDERSTYLRRPPFASTAVTSRLGVYRAKPLLVLGDDITTDHISPAGQIPAGSDAAEYLIARGENPQDLNVFSSRRGNWETMLRGLFTNRSLKNLLGAELLPGTTVVRCSRGQHQTSASREPVNTQADMRPSHQMQTSDETDWQPPLAAHGDTVLPLWKAADRYREHGVPVVVVAGERYGAGSSRDWAAKGLWLLGVRAVLALSFERIHRSNLIGMGILPVRLPSPLSVSIDDWIEVRADPDQLYPRARLQVLIHRPNGTTTITALAAIETSLELTLLKAGGVLPFILQRSAL